MNLIYEMLISLDRAQKAAILLVLDLIWIVVSYFVSFLLVTASPFGLADLVTAVPLLVVMIPVTATLVVYLNLHKIKLIAYELQGVVETAGMAVFVGISGLVVNAALNLGVAPQTFVIFSMTFVLLDVSFRLLLRNFVIWIYSNGRSRQRVLIYGAGQTGQQFATALHTDDELQPIAFVDDNPTLQSLTIAGLRVFSPIHVKELVKRKNISRVILAMPSANQPARARIARKMRELGVQVHTPPSIARLVGNNVSLDRNTRTDIFRLLGRSRLESDLPGVSDAYTGRSVLVTGAGGSIGSELCRQIVLCQPKCLILFDHSEFALYNVQRELSAMAPDLRLIPILGSVTEAGLVDQVFSDFDIDVVLHAAAYKHLPMVEENCIEGFRNNVFGTRLVADAARKYRAERFILVSTDKAVRPTSCMGASKRLAELVVQDLATRSEQTMFSMVRFGNVLGSSGSVVPLFEEQIARGGPVTVTHRDVTRYFMTVPEAVRLVLLAGTFARGGDVFVLDMGRPVSIRRVARQMIEGAGLTVKDAQHPHGDIEILITGLRPGEKLHEELLIGTDMLTTPHPKILRAQENKLSELEVANMLQDLRKAISAYDVISAQAIVNKWVETGEEQELLEINE